MSQTPPDSPQTPPAAPRASGGRAARTGFDITIVAAVLVPLLAVVASLLVDTGAEARPDQPPEEAALTAADVVCPAGGSKVQVASTSGASGDLQVRAGTKVDVAAPVAPGRTTEVDTGKPAAVVSGTGDLAPGLVAQSFAQPLASFDCRAPVYDYWFTGLGAGARHQSTLQLVNPDEGRAVVDVEVYSADGLLDVEGLRGVTISGGESRAFDLAKTLPRRDELALHVTVVRGRVAASVSDAVRGVAGAGRNGDDGLGSQDEPATSNLLLGIPGGSGPRILMIANPNTTAERATIKLVTTGSTFAPSGVEEIELPPQSVVPVPLTKVLAEAGKDDEAPVGLLVESSAPTTASLQMFYRRDLVRSVPATPLEGPGTTVVPAGSKTLVLGDATGEGVVTVSLWDADGKELPQQRIEVAAGRADTYDVPDEARLMTVEPARTSIAAAVLVTNADGATLLRVREPVSTALVPAVSPGVP